MQLYRDTVDEREARATEECGGPQRVDYRGAVALEEYVDTRTGEVRYSIADEQEPIDYDSLISKPDLVIT